MHIGTCRSGIDPSKIEDVIVGCVSQTGGQVCLRAISLNQRNFFITFSLTHYVQAGNVGRGMVLASKHLPVTVPGTSVDRQCGSSQQVAPLQK